MLNPRRLLLPVLLIGLVLRLGIAWAPFDPWQLQHGPLVDDSFYYFQIAKNVAAGLGPTHDGVVMTSGFQPLWAAMLVPIWWLAGSDSVLPIHQAMTLAAGIAALTGWGIWRLVDTLSGPTGALCSVALWSLSPAALDHTENGLETGLAACLLVWTALLYLQDPSWPGHPARLAAAGVARGPSLPGPGGRRALLARRGSRRSLEAARQGPGARGDGGGPSWW